MVLYELQELDHLDEEEIDNYLYGEDEDSIEGKAVEYQFEVCDSLLNIGPCGQVFPPLNLYKVHIKSSHFL